MPDATVIDKYPKATVSDADVQQIRTDKLNNGAKSCVLTEDDTSWILTTVWPGG
jgi:hypothetical protein